MERIAGSLAVLFPGQGVGDEGSRGLVREHRPDLLALATELVGEDPFGRLREGTRFAQPGVYCAALAGYERLGRPEADLLAGHSLGEITALAVAGAIDEEDGLRIVVERGRLMQLGTEEGEAGGMLAVGVGSADAQVLAHRHGLTIANENSPEQVVLSGDEPGLEAAEAEAQGAGLRAKRLRIAGPFHTQAMATAVPPFRDVLADVRFRPTAATVISGVTAAAFSADPRGALANALVSPVRWTKVLRRLRAGGAQRFIDVGPGRVLAGLVRRTLDGAFVDPDPDMEAANV